MKKIFLVLSLLIFVGSSTQAQKYGHLNFGNLIAVMPETKGADTQLEAYQKELVAQGEKMATAFQEKVTDFYSKVQNGTIAPAEQQKRQSVLEQEQAEIVKYEQELGQKLDLKRRELLNPIVEKAQKAIEAVAKENNYQFIFDTSVFNALLHVEDKDDLMPLVKAKLGIQ